MRARAARRSRSVAGLLVLALACLIGSELPASAADVTSDPSPSSTPTATSPATTGPSSGAAERKEAQRREAERKEAADRVGAREAAKARADAQAKAEEEAVIAAERALEAAHDAAKLVAASAALAAAQADLVVARQALTTARDQLATAQQADAAAQTDLDASVLSEERAIRDLADVEARITARQEDLGRLARTAYQSNGSMGNWALVLSSATTDELTERLAFLQSIGSAGNAVMAELAVDRADLRAAQNRLTAARELAESRRQAAAAALATVSATEMLARAAERQVDAVVKAREAALNAARDAAVEDRRRYQALMVQSGALAARITDLAARIAEGKRAPQGSGVFVRPGTGETTSPFGPRLHPILNYVKIHTGTDFGAGDGIAYAADDGVVLFTEFNVAYGNMTVIDHGKIGGVPITTLYAHQAAVGVKPGDRVVRGQAIGVIGSTGYSTGPHLHFEVRVDGEPLDPAPFLRDARLPSQLARTR